MKNIITYLLIIFVSFAYNHETVEFFAQTLGTTLIAMIDEPEEEEQQESKESKEKSEKSKFSDDPFLGTLIHTGFLQAERPAYKQHINFSPSDYSQVVYSPPERFHYA